MPLRLGTARGPKLFFNPRRLDPHLLDSTTSSSHLLWWDIGGHKMSDEPRKRSRFDQTEPEPARKSRFDRRSRSPAGRQDSESHRSRSPIRSDERPGSEGGDKKSAAAAAAAAAAAKINASINAKKGIQHVDVPPIRAVWPTSTCISTQHGTDILCRLKVRPAREQRSRHRHQHRAATSTSKMVTSSKTLK
jgi:hypothetical protein